MLRVVLTHENSAYGAVGINDDAVRKRLIRGAPWVRQGPRREGVRLEGRDPLSVSGRARRRKKGRNSTECLLCFFSPIDEHKNV